ncbi:thiol reductant ABC exporter subunit CydC [Staphylococcus pettenkoferi]|uniref:Thiol reductant ABC exporter subunit CydC n=1 Tax=Staphylococcus pettenkoferi TaxID=170573 RepID=A0ABT4BP40_9STAP|nr:thiol reductant ABC exporter subunit CydC [Staphylococcus pettenkoferi]MCI2803160.1 thiol reductant ABC exporter subunit CydC [Staphylococcus pettenkoferi]MCY1564209.1 thiol reductant ABC exporter subunit CydC [Staphylococcus pettenkoferi]MCY1572234.1 thiol reductant ABC exporter subunit CydC [Staphylococcus pettenkoferi]MCY1583512.1 thiol reductant ABC exporter subunit CydC [Staphylococcus pettenkoferi]MCY1589200.1 thiol reductant ABC exporter subunit CydC [Staphylococcus pettenkoferi]
MKIRPDRDLILSILVGIIGSLVALGMFFLSGYMVTESALGAPLFALMVLVVSVKMFGFLRAIARYIERLLSHRTTFTMLRDVRVQLYRGLVPVVPDVYRRFRSSDLLARIVNRVESLQNVYLRVYYPPIVIGITAMITLVTMMFFSYVHALIILASMGISLGVLPWLSAKKAQCYMQQVAQDESQFLGRFYDYKVGYSELARFNQQATYHQMAEDDLKRYQRSSHKEQQFISFYDLGLNLVSMVALFLTLWLGVAQVQAGHVNVIYLTSIVLMLLTLFEQAVPMSNVAYYKAETDRAWHDINEVIAHSMSQEPSYTSDETSSEPYEIELRDVDFRYANQESQLLHNVHLRIQAGEHVALIGPSGSGKSTLLQLILGLYQSEAGQVMIKGVPTHELTDEEKYTLMSGSLQSQQLFDGTLRENLLSDADDTTLRAVLDVLDLSHLDLDKQVTLEGQTLSGGEKVRLGLARLLLRDLPVWVIDEPTTALDRATADKVMNVIHERAQTLIVATHDLNILPQFDKVAVVIDGQIVEFDRYETLMSTDSYLKRVVELS